MLQKFESSNVIISVIIPTYNRSQLLDYTLHSLCNQTLHVKKFEVIIADDGSRDDTAHVVEKYGDKLNIKYVFQEDQGYRVASARNLGIRQATGKIIALIDSGILLSERCLEEHLQSHMANALPVAVIGYVYGFDQENNNEKELQSMIYHKVPDITINAFKAKCKFLDLREECYLKYQDDIKDLPAPWAFFWTCNVSILSESLSKSGLFDQNFDGYWGVEDHEMGYRLHKDKVQFIINRNASSIHYPHAKDREERIKQELRNKQYFHHKHNSDSTRIFLESDFSTVNEKILQFHSWPEKV